MKLNELENYWAIDVQPDINRLINRATKKG
ncbi:hypothetical protein T472_0206680 [Youngiibacter fragilis 232.1]|uniref:Uncharacterized protein n=1 Tax=Youngiibacter fragilis 232.1 TaxID=994573 RepID=V7I566_9CLOT|nr:hypothetical protein T472_0206680 [Youngiibacter fragilis 232.1]